MSVLKLEDGIRGHKAFVKACCQAASLYLLLHKADSEEVAKPQEAVDPKLAKALAKREKAKAAKAKRKAEADAKAQAEAAKEAAKNDDSKKKLPKRDADDDPRGEKLAALEPLKEATRLSKALEKYAASAVETCVEINKCRFLGNDVAALVPSSGEESTPPRHRAGVVLMAWRSTRRFSTNAP